MSRHRLRRFSPAPAVPALFLAAAAVLAATGCASRSNQPDQKTVSIRTVIRYQPGADVPATVDSTAPQDGYYELFRGDKSVARFHLKAGDPLGFASRSVEHYALPKPDQVFAVGGDRDVLLEPGAAYEWRLVPYRTRSEKWLHM